MIIKTTGLNPNEDHIAHYGILGMRWGHRKQREREKEKAYKVHTKKDIANVPGFGTKTIYKSDMKKAKKMYSDITSGNKYRTYPALRKYNQQLMNEISFARQTAHNRWTKAYKYKSDAYANGDMAKYQTFRKLEKKYRRQEYDYSLMYMQQQQRLKDNPYAFPESDILSQVLEHQYNQLM